MKGGVCGEDGAVAEVAEAFLWETFLAVAFDDRSKHFHRSVEGDARSRQAVEAFAVILRSKVKRVLVWGTPHQADLREVRPRTAVWTAGDAQADSLTLNARFDEVRLELREELGQDAFALRQGETASGQRHAGH